MESTNVQIYKCNKCSYSTILKSNYKKHLLTIKHQIYTNENNLISKNININYSCNICKKKYKTKSGMWKHTQTCTVNELNNTMQTVNKENLPDNELIKLMIEQNFSLQQQLLDQQNKHHEEMLSIIPKVGNNNTNNNNVNNIMVFLNEECKDAINLSEFIKMLPITLNDLLCTQNKGLVTSTQNIIVDGLKLMELTKRPIHCTDEKRKTMYIKEDGKWDKDGNNNKLKESIHSLASQQSKNLSIWEEEYPDYKDKQDTYEHYIKLVSETCKNIKNDDARCTDQILKSIGKETKLYF